MEQVFWNRQTRLLHMGMASLVTLQLFISLVMEAPDEEGAAGLGHAAFEVHEMVGFAAVIVVFLHWVWSLRDQTGGGIRHLFPWRGEGWAAVKADVQDLSKRRLPAGGPRGGLPGLVHGLGFLAVTGMALTGAVLLVLLPESGEPPEAAELFAEVHEFISSFVWLYWIGHVGLAVMHHMKGEGNLRAMFRIGKTGE